MTSDPQSEMELMDDDDDDDEGVPPLGEIDVSEEDEPLLEAQSHSPVTAFSEILKFGAN